MNEEEKEAIEDIKEMIELYENDCLLTTGDDIRYLKIILNLIDKQQKEIEEYNKKCDECNFNKSGICKELKAYNCCSIQSVLELLKELLGE